MRRHLGDARVGHEAVAQALAPLCRLVGSGLGFRFLGFASCLFGFQFLVLGFVFGVWGPRIESERVLRPSDR